MQKIRFRQWGSIALLSFVSITAFAQTSPHGQKRLLKTIILDAGHGGIDPGARGLITTEAAVTLDITLKLGEAIQKEFPDIKIVYTRTTDELPGKLRDIKQALRYRADLANLSKGDLFISIHCNSNGKPPGGYYAKKVIGYKNKMAYTGRGKRKRKRMVRAPVYESYWVVNTTKGTESYIWAADRSGSKSDFITQTDETGEDVQDTLNVLDLNSPESRIRGQLYEKLYFKKSAQFASNVEESFKAAGRTSYGVKQRNYKGIWVLQATGMPSVLIETGFVTNKEEEEYLASDAGQNEIVENIMTGLKQYKEEVEGTPKAAVN